MKISYFICLLINFLCFTQVDDFEEVVIPCFVEPKKIKGRPAKDSQKNNTRKSKKPHSTAKGAKQQGNINKPLGNRAKTKTNLTKPGGKQDTLPGRGQGENTGKNPIRPPDIQANTGATGEESGLDDQRAEVHPLEGPLSAATSLQLETSNDSYRGDTLGIEHEGTERRNSDSEEQEDDGNSDIEHDGYEEEDEDDYIDGEGAECIDDSDALCDVAGDVRSEVDTETSGCDSDANVVTTGAVPAKNLHRSQDGRVVLLWTRQAIFALLLVVLFYNIEFQLYFLDPTNTPISLPGSLTRFHCSNSLLRFQGFNPLFPNPTATSFPRLSLVNRLPKRGQPNCARAFSLFYYPCALYFRFEALC